ncbi:MAG: hypothetical protein JW973_11760 [Bacteroidales bacterium]|nr:hypothetical protein [Bacteroidales bacterium]
MKSYSRRLIKFLLFVIVVFFVLLFLWPLLSKGVSLEETYHSIVINQRMVMILVILLAYCFLYPLINFGKKERYISGNFADNRSIFEETMQEAGYLKKAEDGSALVYKKKSVFSRIMMLGEDTVEIDTKANPLIIDGPKRDLRKIDALLDSKLLKEKG